MKIEQLKQYDTTDIFSVILNFKDQILDAVEYGRKLTKFELDKNRIQNVVITGLGGSAIGGDLIKMFLKNKINIPILVNRDYFLPKFVNENTLVIVSSYSGNTEETISAYKDAIQKKAQVICIGSGGKISEMANQNHNEILSIPKGFQPRFAVGYMFFNLLYIFVNLGFINEPKDEINEVFNLLEENKKYSELDDNNEILLFAEKLVGKFIFIYAACDLEPLAVRFRGQLAENSKVISSHHVFPEMNHNEIVAWTKLYSELFKNSAIIFLSDDTIFYKINHRIEITKSIIKNFTDLHFDFNSKCKTSLGKIFDLINRIDWITYYLSIYNKVNPAEIKNIDFLKNKLSDIA